jgi:hypothetical protein
MPASNARVALVAAAANLTLCALVGATLLITSAKEPELTAGSVAPAVSLPDAPGPTMSSSPEPTSTSTTTSTTARQDIDPASGDNGFRTVVPRGWPAAPINNQPGSFQATDPARTSHYVRFGGYSASGDIQQFRVSAEQEAKTRLPGLVRLRLEPRTVRGFGAVDWEFTWDGREGQQRHVRAIYWRTGGTEYFVYVSSPASDWAEMEPFLAVMLDNSTP